MSRLWHIHRSTSKVGQTQQGSRCPRRLQAIVVEWWLESPLVHRKRTTRLFFWHAKTISLNSLQFWWVYNIHFRWYGGYMIYSLFMVGFTTWPAMYTVFSQKRGRVIWPLRGPQRCWLTCSDAANMAMEHAHHLWMGCSHSNLNLEWISQLAMFDYRRVNLLLSHN